MAAVALIKFTQGSNTDTAGRAVKGDLTSGTVTVSNGSDVSVVSWKYELLYVPPGSSIPTTVQGPNTTPTFTFAQPDVSGTYRVRLTVTDANGNVDVDIRCFCVPFPNGIIAPPYQGYPACLPLTGAGSKPNEMNLGGQPYGWDGNQNTSYPLLYQALQTLDGLKGGTGIDHNTLNNLTVGDVHTQYVKLTGRAGGQTLIGGTAAGNNLVLQSTINVSRGVVQLADTLDLASHPITNVPYQDYVPSASPTFQEGRVYYNNVDKALSVHLAGGAVDQQLGQESLTRCVNKTGSLIPDGTVVYISGAQGNRPTISLASATTAGAAEVIGVATEDIANNAEGFVTVFGVVHGYNTSGFAAGDILYVSATAGTLTNVAPTAPNYAVPVGVALNSTNNGSIFVHPQPPPKVTVGTGLVKSGNQLSVDPNLTTLGPYNFTNIFDVATHEPSGWALPGFTNTECTISATAGTRTFAVTPTGTNFSYWIRGQQYTSTAQSVVWTATEGEWFFYFDTTNTLKATQSVTTWQSIIAGDGAPVAVLYWDNANSLVLTLQEERHGTRMDGATHGYLHNYFHTQYMSGLGLGNFTIQTGGSEGSTNAGAQFSVANGVAADEDIVITVTSGSPQVLSPTANIPIYYLSGATPLWRKKTADSYPFIQSGAAGYTSAAGRSAYNQNNAGTWQLTDAGQGNYFHVFYFVSNDVNTPIFGVLGSATYATLNAADTAVSSEAASIMSYLPALTAEYKLLSAVTFHTSTSFANTPKTSIVNNPAGASFYDYRTNGVTAGIGAIGTNIAYSSLTGQPTLTGTAPVQVAGVSGTPQILATDLNISLAVGGANQVLWSNGSANSWTGTPTVTSLDASSYLAIGAAPATTGGLRMTNATPITYRNGANTANLSVLTMDGSNNVALGSTSTASTFIYCTTNTQISIGGSTVFLADTSSVWAYKQFRFGAAVSAPTISQYLDATDSVTGQTLTVQAQNCTGTTSTGGSLVLKSGTGTTAAGVVQIANGGTVCAEFSAGTTAAVNLFANAASSSSGNWLFRGAVGTSSSAAMYGSVAPGGATSTNFCIKTDGVSLFVNTPSAGGVFYLQIGGTTAVNVVNNGFSLPASISSPTIKQNDNSTASATGQTLTLQAQNCTGTTSTGGNLVLASGSGTGTQGAVRVLAGATQVAQLDISAVNLYASAASASSGNVLIRGYSGNNTYGAVYFSQAAGAITATSYNLRGTASVTDINAGTTVGIQVAGTGVASITATEINLYANAASSSSGNWLLRGQVGTAANAALYANMAPGSATSSNATLLVTSTYVVLNAPSSQLAFQIGASSKLTIFTTSMTSYVSTFAFDTAVTSPTIKQSDNSTASATGQTLYVQAQNCTGTTSTGGSLILRSGTGTTANGNVYIQGGATNIVSMNNVGVYFSVPVFAITNAAGVASIYQEPDTTASATGKAFTIRAQNATGATSTGGNLVLTSGTGTTIAGNTLLQTGGVTRVTISPTSVVQSTATYNFASTVTSPRIGQADSAATGTTGQALTICAQNVPDLSSQGGDLILSSGAGGAYPGAVRIKISDGAYNGILVEPAQTALYGSNYLALTVTANGLTLSSTGNNPSSNPATGSGYLFVDSDGSLNYRNPSNVITRLA